MTSNIFEYPTSGIDRRRILQGIAGGIATTGAMTLFGPAVRAAKPIKIGYVSPKSGPLAAFAEADDFVLGEFRKFVKDGLKVGSQIYPIEVVTKDSQSNPNRAAEVAKELITRDNVSIILVGATPETNNPVATQCELEQIPCISSVAPWQTNFIGRQANPADPKSWKPFDYTFHYFWGLEDVIGVFTGMWQQVATNKSVGALFPNDADGNAWGDKAIGFPPVLAAQGFRLTDPGRFQNLTDDFSSQISAFRGADAEIVTGVIIPPDFTTFWNQSRQKGLKPKVVSVAKALLFPATVLALGKSGNNISTEVCATEPADRRLDDRGVIGTKDVERELPIVLVDVHVSPHTAAQRTRATSEIERHTRYRRRILGREAGLDDSALGRHRNRDDRDACLAPSIRPDASPLASPSSARSRTPRRGLLPSIPSTSTRWVFASPS